MLSELLVGVLITVTVMAAGTWALLALLRTEGTNQQELNRKDEVERLLGLVQAEVFAARRVETSSSAAAALSGCSHSPKLILRGNSASEDISYASVLPADLNANTVVNRSSISWRGPRVLVRCGLPYTSAGVLDTSAARNEQVVLDSVRENTTGDGGFSLSTAAATASTVARNLAITLTSDASGLAVSSSVQVPINSNDTYGLLSTATTCASSSGCIDPSDESIYFTPAAGATVDGTSAVAGGREVVVYFSGLKSDYSISRYNCSGNALISCYRVQARTGAPVNIMNGNVLVFRDVEIRI